MSVNKFPALWAAYESDRSIENRNALVVAHEPMVVWYSKCTRRQLPLQYGPLDEDDLRQCLRIGLAGAVEDYDPARGSFSSLACWRFRGAISRLMANTSWAPATVMNDVRRGKATLPRFSPAGLWSATDTRSEPPDVPVMGSEEAEWLGEVLMELSEKKRRIMRLRFWDELTFREIGELLGVSYQYVKQVEDATIERIRERFIEPGVRKIS